MNGNHSEAYSQLRIILAKLNLTVFQLHRRLGEAGFPVNIKSLYRLASEEPLQKIDLRIAAAICQTCGVSLGELITLDKPRTRLTQLDRDTQARLDVLMAKNNDGALSAREEKEFGQLVEKAHRISMENARVLLAQRRRNARSQPRVGKRREAVAA